MNSSFIFSFLNKVKGRVFNPQQGPPRPQVPRNDGTVSSAFKTAHEQLIIDQYTKNQRGGGGREITQVFGWLYIFGNLFVI